MTNLTLFLKRITDIAYYIAITVFGIAIVAVLVVAFSDTGGEPSVNLPVRFAVDTATVPLESSLFGAGMLDTALGEASFQGSGPGWFIAVSILGVAMFAVPALFVLSLLRRVLATVVEGDPFAEANVRRIRTIGLLVIIFELLRQTVGFAIEALVMSTTEMPGFTLQAVYEGSLTIIFVGLVVVVLSEVFRYGRQLQLDSDLTV
ncbi:MAG: DUF2975 domain-containing protein [Anaerosomatales bacterium]|nr:DUF2975 domain-containing protein [Anaerosomatales bacterium]